MGARLLSVAIVLLPLAAATGQTDEVAVIPVPLKDREYYSLVVPVADVDNKQFFGLSFDSSRFIPSAAPYGLPDSQNRWECPYNKLSSIAETSRDMWSPNQDLLLRRMMDLPAGVSSLRVRITAFRAVAVYINGQPVTGNGADAKVELGGLCAAQDNLVFTIPDRFVRTGPNLIAVRVFGAAELNYFDMQVEAFYPRPTGNAGNVYTWGKGYYGVLGNGYEEDSFTPSRILDIKDLKGVALNTLSMGVAHTLLLTKTGKLYSWGRGKESQLGYSEEYMEVPMAVSAVNALGTIKSAVAGSLHNLVLDSNGRLYCFGDNSAGQCGLGEDGEDGAVPDPQRVTEVDDEVVSLISAKDMLSTAVTVDGRIYVWGNGNKVPRFVDVMSNVVAISAGSHHVLLLNKAGQVFSFGLGPDGQLGLRSGGVQSDKPALVEGLQGLKIVSVVAGTDNSFAITAEGKVYVWGAGSFGKNGLGVWAPQMVPVQITALSQYNIRSVGAGMTSTLFLTDKGSVYVTGANLRDGSHVLQPVLWASASDKFFVEVYASHLHFAAVTNPSLWDWTKADNYFRGTRKPIV
eukprot:c9295_g1_i1.p1 GENE.c9295_g1_i1~~c9295_g1_i1.p1  ORF type:complete len:584 (+),score=125.41 c9295_g1_i1:35-1753(+)